MADIVRYLEEHPGLFVVAGALVSAICALIGVWISWRKLKRDRNELQGELGTLKQEYGQLQATNEHLKADRAQADQAAQAASEELQVAVTRAQEKQTELTRELEAAAERALKMETKAQRDAKLVRQMLQLEGCFWKKRIHTGAPRFRALADRKSAIISILNLKGGVGKTTIAAHLAAALAARGYRPLLIDTDLQGSLSSMFIPADLLSKRAKEDQLLLQHFLTHAAQQRRMNLLDFIVPILDGQGGLVATTDKMAYAELNLTMHWLLRLGRRDTRFLLRRALHQRRVTNRYDVILLDCPPLINTCCVNALAASDYVLIPVMPSRKSAERVPQLLKTLADLKSRINPLMQPLGLVLNRTYGRNLTALETDLWTQTQTHAQDQWGSPVYGCRTHIRQTTEVRTVESEFTAPEPGSELHDTFKRLVIELEERLPVNVDELQLHLSNLAQLLDKAGGGKVARDLEELCQRLQPHRTKRMKDLFDLLDKAEEIVRTGTPPPRSRGGAKKQKADPQVVESLGNRIVDLYHRPVESTREEIVAAFSELDGLGLTVKELQALAKRIDITQKLTKATAIETMRRVVLERKGARERVEV